MNNWQDVDVCITKQPPETLSTRCGGQGIVIFYGMAKPVQAPQIGPGASVLTRIPKLEGVSSGVFCLFFVQVPLSVPLAAFCRPTNR